MIHELSVKPKQSNTKAKYTCFACAVTAVALLVVSMCVPHYRSIVGIVCLVFITAALFIYTKYLSSSYFYDITFDHVGRAVFVVRQRTGKRDSTMCRINISSIESVEEESREARRAHKVMPGTLKYNYVPTMDPDATLRIISQTASERSEIVIEASAEFAALLRDYAAIAKANEAAGIPDTADM